MERNITAGKYLLGYAHETVVFYLYFFAGFLVPFTLGHPQQVVGVVVNATLILSALEVKQMKMLLPLIFAPSLGVLARGVIFGPMTPYLLIMMPFIWVGNALLVFGVRELYNNRNKNYVLSLGASSIVKSAFLFSVAFIFVSMSILPELFLTAMGVFQLATALVGGVLAFGIYKSKFTNILGF